MTSKLLCVLLELDEELDDDFYLVLIDCALELVGDCGECMIEA